MSLSTSLRRDIVVSFSIEDVKKSIDIVCEKSRASYQIKEKNDIMNTYTISLVGGLALIVPCSIQLKKITDEETSIILECNKVNKTPNQYNEIVDKFLNLVSKSLSGEIINENVVAQNKSGCLGLFIFLISSTLLGLIVSCNKETTTTNSSSCGYYTFSNGTTTPVSKGTNNGCYYINSNGNKTYVDSKYCCN